MDRLSATLKLTSNAAGMFPAARPATDRRRITFSGAYAASQADWKSGQVQAQVAVRSLPATRVQALTALDTGLDGRVYLRGLPRARPSGPARLLAELGVRDAVRAVRHLPRPAAGRIRAHTADTRGEQVSVDAKGKLDAANLDWPRDVALECGRERLRHAPLFAHDHRGRAPASHVTGRRTATRAMRRNRAKPGCRWKGFVEGGSIAVTVALRHPRDFQALVTLDGVQFNPKSGQALGLDVQPQDVVLKSAMPVVFAVNLKEARFQPARLTGRDTNLEISGTIPFSSSAGGADLAVRGTVNLVALQLLNPNLLARGNASVEATLRGALADPALSGRMDLKNASLYLKDVATGLDNVNGGVLFNRNRATIDKVTAQIGSGTLALGGFVEFGSPLVYRLQAAVQQIRVRLPIDVSTTFSANLALTGTSDASTLSGNADP